MGVRATSLIVALGLVATAPVLAQEDPDYATPNARIQELFATDKNFVELGHMSPDGNHFLVPHYTELSTLARMAEPTLRLGELEIRPRTYRPWHLDTYGIDGLRTYSLARGSYQTVEVPEGSFVSDLMWSPRGDRVAYLLHGRDATEVWWADASTGRAHRMSNTRIVSTLASSARGQGEVHSRMLQWTPEGSVITLARPRTLGSPPNPPTVPTGPMVRSSGPEATPNPTYPNLLRDAHDADLFEHYTTSQIVEIREDGSTTEVGAPGMYERLVLSPDGQYLMATRIVRPFSYITSFRGFPRVTEVIDRDGRVVATLDERPLREASGRTAGAGSTPERQGWAWRPSGSTLSFFMEIPSAEDDTVTEAAHGIYTLTAPFRSEEATLLAESDDPIRDFVYAPGAGHLFATVSRDGLRAVAHWPLNQGTRPEPNLVISWYDPARPIEDPGTPWVGRTSNGIEFARITTNGRALLVSGPGWADDLRPTPFVDHVALSDGMRNRVFQGSKESYDRPLVPLDVDGARLIVSREGVHDFPDSFLWVLGEEWTNLTHNVDPFPEITAARRIDFEFERRDGLNMRGRVSLPVDYVEGTKVPAIFWTYPREYRSEELYRAATVTGRNLNAFSPLSWLRWSDIWLTQGYALVYPDIPIVGENYNDFYISNMVDDMYAAVRAVDGLGVIDIDRIGHGGHSYGAFATANFLAHTPFFRAGIAGDGAYNRSLTPMGFQAEPRDIWEAPHIYMEMSPFFKADQINTPMLMYHGGDDNNTGTFPVQSERLMMALQGLGKTAELYIYPFESHTPRAIENKLDMWARFISWFDLYVKGDDADRVSQNGSGR